MVAEPERQQNLAVLIDADNTSPSVIEYLFAEIAKYGMASVKRIYGDWTSPYLKGWKEVLLTYAIHPIQQFHYTVGKNATDSAMIIDAMDLLYSNRFDGFCLVSSDSDFTRLATRIREGGITVYGFGKREPPTPSSAPATSSSTPRSWKSRRRRTNRSIPPGRKNRRRKRNRPPNCSGATRS